MNGHKKSVEFLDGGKKAFEKRFHCSLGLAGWKAKKSSMTKV